APASARRRSTLRPSTWSTSRSRARAAGSDSAARASARTCAEVTEAAPAGPAKTAAATQHAKARESLVNWTAGSTRRAAASAADRPDDDLGDVAPPGAGEEEAREGVLDRRADHGREQKADHEDAERRPPSPADEPPGPSERLRPLHAFGQHRRNRDRPRDPDPDSREEARGEERKEREAGDEEHPEERAEPAEGEPERRPPIRPLAEVRVGDRLEARAGREDRPDERQDDDDEDSGEEQVRM